MMPSWILVPFLLMAALALFILIRRAFRYHPDADPSSFAGVLIFSLLSSLLIVVFLALSTAVAEGLRFLLAPAPLIVHSCSLAFIFAIVVLYRTPDHLREDILSSFGVNALELELGVLVAALATLPLSFGLFSREVFECFPLTFSGVEGVSRLQWLAFGYSNLVEAFMWALYDVHFTTITPKGFWAISLAFSFRLGIDLLVIRTIRRQLKKSRYKEFGMQL